MKEDFKNIWCRKESFKNGSWLIFEVRDWKYNKIKVFEHPYCWSKKDDLLIRMQKEINITTQEFNAMWGYVQKQRENHQQFVAPMLVLSRGGRLE